MKALKRTIVSVIVALLVSALMGIGSLGCNTVKGAGKDVQKGGKSIEHAAQGAQEK